MKKQHFLSTVLDRPIAFHRVFVGVAGGVLPALMLSQAVYWAARTDDPDGWFYKTAEEWKDEIGFSRKELETARSRLTVQPFWQEKLAGAPARLHYRVDLEALLKVLQGEVQPLTVDDVLTTQRSQLIHVSKAGYMRARKTLGVENTYLIDYANVLSKHGMTCAACGKQIVGGLGTDSQCLSFAYVTPLPDGGTHDEDNLRPVHIGCRGEEIEDPDCLPETNQIAYPKQTSLFQVNNLVCLPETNSYIETETTAETTSLNPTRAGEENLFCANTGSEAKSLIEEKQPDRDVLADHFPAGAAQSVALSDNMGLDPLLSFARPDWRQPRGGNVGASLMASRIRSSDAGLDPATETALVNEMADIYGTLSLVDAGDDGELLRLKGLVLLLWGMEFRTVKQVRSLKALWDEKYPTWGIPQGKQFIQFASAVKDGKVQSVEDGAKHNGQPRQPQYQRKGAANTTGLDYNAIQAENQRLMEQQPLSPEVLAMARELGIDPGRIGRGAGAQ